MGPVVSQGDWQLSIEHSTFECLWMCTKISW